MTMRAVCFVRVGDGVEGEGQMLGFRYPEKRRFTKGNPTLLGSLLGVPPVFLKAS